LDQEPVSPNQLQPGVPRDLVTVCLKCLQKSPSKRYFSAEALADDLRRFLEGQPILARQTPAWERTLKWARRRPALATMYAVIAGAVVMIGLYNVWLERALTDAENQRGAATTASEERRRQLVQVLLADGARQMEDGDWFGALLPLAEAARLDQQDPSRASVHAVRLNAILRQCPRLVQFWPHQTELRHVEFNPEGSTVMTVAGNQARLWDLANGREISRFTHGGDIRATALSSDGRQLATATDDRRVQLWEIATGNSLGVLPPRDGELVRIAFVAGTNNVAMVTRRAENSIQIQVWDIVGGKAVSPELHAETGVLFDIAFSPDGMRAFTAGAALTVWEVKEARSIFEERDASIVTQARFSPDGQFVAAADVTGAVRVWDAGSGKRIATVRHPPPVRDVAFSPDGRLIITGGVDGVARVWRLPDGALAAELRHGPAFTHAVSHVSFSPDGRHSVLVAGADNTARIWSGVQPASPLLRHSDRITHASFSPDGRLVLTACADGTVRVWDLAAGRLTVSPLDQDNRVTHVAFDSEGRRVVTATEDGVTRIWDASSGRPQEQPFVHDFPVRSAEFISDGRIVITSEDNTRGEGEASIWDPAKRKLVFRRATEQKVQGVAPNDRGIRSAWFSPNGRYLLTLIGNGAGQVWDTETGERVARVLEHKSSVNGASFSLDGNRLLTNTFAPEYSTQLWEAAGKPLSELYRQLRPDNTATLWELPEGKRIASVGEPGTATAFRHASLVPSGIRLILIRDGVAELRDVNTGELVRSFHKSGTKVTHAALSPDSRIVVTTSDDRTAQLWNADSGEIMPTAPQFQHAGQSWPPLFSPDGRLVALTHPVGVRVWDAATGDPVSPPLIHPADVDCVAFSPDSRLFATASDHAVRLWPLNAEEKDADEFLLLAQMLSCARTNTADARIVPLSSDELARTWDKVRQRFPDAFTTPPADAIAWYAEAARASERNRLWSAALLQLERLTKLDPARSDLYDRKGRVNAELGQMKDAVADFARSTELGADRPGPWYRHALLRLYLGDHKGYRLARDAMLNRFYSERDDIDIQLVVRTCVLSSETKDDSERIVAIAERSLAARPKDHNGMLMLGAALYRAGRYDDAVHTLLECTKIRGKEDVVNDLFLAMAYLRMRETEQGQAYLQQAARLITQAAKASPVSDGSGNARFAWSDRLELLLLQREVQAILNEQTP
jgi:WD40 repeat protein/cytochrome c-type biogenesis protein CcmH/NrfG